MGDAEEVVGPPLPPEYGSAVHRLPPPPPPLPPPPEFPPPQPPWPAEYDAAGAHRPPPPPPPRQAVGRPSEPPAPPAGPPVPQPPLRPEWRGAASIPDRLALSRLVESVRDGPLDVVLPPSSTRPPFPGAPRSAELFLPATPAPGNRRALLPPSALRSPDVAAPPAPAPGQPLRSPSMPARSAPVGRAADLWTPGGGPLTQPVARVTPVTPMAPVARDATRTQRTPVVERPAEVPVPVPDEVVQERRSRHRRQRVQVIRGIHSRRVVRRVDAWTVFKVSLVFYLLMLVIAVAAGVIVWNLAEAFGLIGSIQRSVRSLFALKSFVLHGMPVLIIGSAAGAVLALVGTLMNVVLALVYNLISDVVGGVQAIVVSEPE
ncbi:MAG: DUF3566 domain-containing protein [Acidimicrobiales bacterium]